MATIPTDNKFTGEEKQESGNDDKEVDLDCGSVRGDRVRPRTADAQKGAEIDAKSFLRYDERRW